MYLVETAATASQSLRDTVLIIVLADDSNLETWGVFSKDYYIV